MAFSFKAFYRGPYRYLSVAFIVAVGAGGYFYPVIGLAVPGLMLLALALNFRGRRLFCSGVCPNGRALSAVITPVSKRGRLPAFLVEPGMRRILCGFMLFCMVNLLARYGSGGIAAAGRVFWSIYLVAVGISAVVGIAFKPRSWCAFCPMGTLQDTRAGKGRRTVTKPVT
jgi:polyferredoxin